MSPGVQASKFSTPLRFLLAGGTAAVVNFCARVVLSLFMPYAAAIVVAYLLGMVTAFLLNRQFVFKSASGGLGRQIAWFVSINLFGMLQTLLVSLLLADMILPMLRVELHREEIAHAIGIMVPMFVSYLGHKHLTFR